MKHAVSRELHRYWTVLRGPRSAPERSDIDPAAIRGILADTFILDVDDPQHPTFPIQLAGARLSAFRLGTLKDRPMPSLFALADRPAALRVMRNVVDHQVPALAGLRARPVDGGQPVDLEMILLPLRHRGRTHARLLGAAAPFAVPSWLGLVPTDGFALTTVRFIDDADHGFGRFNAPGRRQGHLTVLQGGRPAGLTVA